MFFLPKHSGFLMLLNSLNSLISRKANGQWLMAKSQWPTYRYRKRYPIEIGVENGTDEPYTTNETNGLRQTHQHIGLICPICPIGLISLKA